MRFLLGCLAAGMIAGCTSTPVVSDAATFDAPLQPLDTASDDAQIQPDAAPCDLACPEGRVCCLDAMGAPQCVDLANDIHNCGVCNRDCVASRRGDSCLNNQCGCGDFEIGCTGNENSICCTMVAGLQPYCANPGLDLTDCGGCGHNCDTAQASQCSGGMCLCGETGGACAGTTDSLCCADPAGDSTCVDTRSDQAHCGGCDTRCTAFEHCVDSHCVSTLFDAGLTDT